MSLWNRILRFGTKKKKTARQLQDYEELKQVYQLLRYRREHERHRDQIDRELTVEFADEKILRDHVRDLVTEQVKTLFQAMYLSLLENPRIDHECVSNINEKLNTFERQVRSLSSDKSKSSSDLSYSSGEHIADSEPQDAKAEWRRRVMKRIGYELTLGPSAIKEAGLGVFATGKIPKGSVATLYPGILYQEHQVKYMNGYPKFEKLNRYLITRYDNVFIDGDESVIVTQEEDGTESRNFQWSDVNPLAVGHIVNHPPAGKFPNVIPCPYDYEISELPRYSASLIPHEKCISDSSSYLGRKVNRPTMTTGMVLVATRDIEDEELYLNYRYNPEAKNLPAWYVDPYPELSKQRWGLEKKE